MKKSKTLYACGTDWDHEIGETKTMLYESIEQLKKVRYCWKSCGIVEIKLSAKTIEQPGKTRTGDSIE